MKKLLVAIALLSAAGVAAQERGRLSRECRSEIVAMCGMNRGEIRTCLREKAKQRPETCRTELISRLRGRNGLRGKAQGAKSAAAIGGQELSYGGDPLQKLDFYSASASGRPPLLVYVHGGGWQQGDKSSTIGREFVPHYRAEGYAVASLNYRLVPTATVEQQAADIAGAVAYLRKQAVQLNFDPDRIVLMGHSAGAHLVALVGTDPQYLRAAGLGLDALRGVIPNDGAAYDVAAQMTDGPAMMQDTYLQAFGTDPQRQRALSPTYHAKGPNAPAFLFIHVQRADGIRQATGLADSLRRAGTRVQINGFPGEGLTGHMEINRDLGDPAYPATPVVDAWLRGVFG